MSVGAGLVGGGVWSSVGIVLKFNAAMILAFWVRFGSWILSACGVQTVMMSGPAVPGLLKLSHQFLWKYRQWPSKQVEVRSQKCSDIRDPQLDFLAMPMWVYIKPCFLQFRYSYSELNNKLTRTQWACGSMNKMHHTNTGTRFYLKFQLHKH